MTALKAERYKSCKGEAKPQRSVVVREAEASSRQNDRLARGQPAAARDSEQCARAREHGSV